MRLKREHINQVLLYVVVDGTISAEGFTPLHMASHRSYEIGILHLVIQITNEVPSSHVTAGNITQPTLLVLPGRRIKHRDIALNLAYRKHFFDSDIILLA